jgi:hypothetical protein
VKRNVITLATGKKFYLDLAINLARSFIVYNRNFDIDFYIVTDLNDELPDDLAPYIKIIPIKPNQYGLGFSPKIHLDKIAPPGRTLFIDSDCLIFDSLLNVFERFEGKTVSVVGSFISTGEWFGNINIICKKFNLPHLPKFNGGLYYLENGPDAIEIYNSAREIEKNYDEIGFVKLRNRPNDEVIMALAMQIHSQTPIADDGGIMSDPQACPGQYQINVINGKRWLLNPPFPHPLHQAWYPFEKVEPIIFHFLGSYTQEYPYKRETYRLKKFMYSKLNLRTELYSKLIIELPDRLKQNFKSTFRPVYRLIFGKRAIKKSERIIE